MVVEYLGGLWGTLGWFWVFLCVGGVRKLDIETGRVFLLREGLLGQDSKLDLGNKGVGRR